MRKQIIGEQCHQPPEAPTASPFQVPPPPRPQQPAAWLPARGTASPALCSCGGVVTSCEQTATQETAWRPLGHLVVSAVHG